MSLNAPEILSSRSFAVHTLPNSMYFVASDGPNKGRIAFMMGDTTEIVRDVAGKNDYSDLKAQFKRERAKRRFDAEVDRLVREMRAGEDEAHRRRMRAIETVGRNLDWLSGLDVDKPSDSELSRAWDTLRVEQAEQGRIQELMVKRELLYPFKESRWARKTIPRSKIRYESRRRKG